MNRFNAIVGMTLLLSSIAGITADASYFPTLTTDEKETYTNWVAAHSSAYPRHAFMSTSIDEDDGAAIFWNIDDNTVNFALAVRAEGWVGFGLSEAGGMLGSDIALFKTSDPNVLEDTHVVDSKSYPLTDDCQDWKLEDSVVENGWIIVEMSRLLDTGDNQDHTIVDDVNLWQPPTRIIAAWGDENYTYHGDSKAKSSVRLFATHSNELSEMDALVEKLEANSDGYFDYIEPDIQIPADETHYEDLCRTFPNQTAKTMIGAVPVIQEETREHLHHFLVYVQKDCTEESSRKRTLVYAWAPGDEGMALPDDVGFPIFDGENNQAIYLQIHYDNPRGIAGRKDNSGIRLYYINGEREHRAGILELGDPWLGLNEEAIAPGFTQYTFECPQSCSYAFLTATERSGSEGITVISEFLHMHQTGVRMTNEVMRNGEVVNVATSEVYDFEHQGGYHVPQGHYQVLPGDSMRTRCYYEDGGSFGLGSAQEMCIAYLLYYPAQSFGGTPWICPHMAWEGADPTCASQVQYSSLESAEGLERDFGDSSGNCADDQLTDNSGIETPAPPTDSNVDAPAAGPATTPTTTPEPPTTVTFPAPVPSPTTTDMEIADPESGSEKFGVASLLTFVNVMIVVILV